MVLHVSNTLLLAKPGYIILFYLLLVHLFLTLICYCYTVNIYIAGQYALLTPFYNGVFSGKSARVTLYDAVFGQNLQELDFVRDRENNGTYKGFRGSFTSLWQGVENVAV